MLARFLRFLQHLFVRSPLPDLSESSPPQAPSRVQGDDLEFNNRRPAPIEGEIVWENESFNSEKPFVIRADGPTILFRKAQDNDSPNPSYYRDEDGELRPVRLDRS